MSETVRRERRIRFGPLLVLILGSMLASTVSAEVEAASIASTQTGNWDVGTTWVGGVSPVAGDDVTIASSHTVTVTAAAAAGTITIAANTSGTNGIIINSGITLDVSGAITMTAPTSGTSTIDVGAGTLLAASIAIPGSATAGRYCTVTVSTGTITTTGSIAFSGTAAQARFTSTGASTANVAGNFGGGGTLTTSSTGTINLNGGAAQTLGAYTTYNNVTLNNTSGGVSLTGTTTIGGTLTITTGTLTVGAYTMTVTGASSVTGTLSITSATGTKAFNGNVTINNGGTWDNTTANVALTLPGSLQNDGTFNAGTGVYTFSGTSKTISGANAVAIPSLTVTGTVTNNGTLTVATALAGNGTLTNGANASLNIGGTTSINTLAASANPNTVTYDGAAQSILTNMTYHHLVLAGSGTKTQTGANQITTNGDLTFSGTATMTTTAAVTVNGALTVGSTAAFTIAGFNFTASGSTTVNGTLALSSTAGSKTFGNIVVNNGGTMSFTAAEGLTVNGNLQVDGSGAITGTTGTWTFQKAGGGGTISGSASSITLGAATFTTSYTVSIPCTSSGTLTVTATTLTNNSTVTAGGSLSGTGDFIQGTGATLNVGGSSGITVLTASANPNTVNYNGSANQTVKKGVYHNLTITSTGGTVTADSLTINNDFTVTSGTVSSGSTLVTVSNNLTVTSGSFAPDKLTVTGTTSVSGTMSATGGGSSIITFVGAVTVNAGGVWSGSRGATFRGGLTHNGASFNNTGVHTFDTNNQAIGGSSAITMGSITVTGVTLTNNLTDLSLTSDLLGTGGFTMTTGSTLNIGGSSTITTLTATAVPNTVNYNGAANQTINATTYHNLKVTSTGGTVTCGSVTVNNDFTVVSGTASLGTSTVTGATSISGTLSVSPAGTKTFVGAVTINAGGVWSGTSRDVVLRGGLTHNGSTFTSGTGIYTFNTNNQSIGGTGAISINNVTVTGVTLTNNSSDFSVPTALSGTGGLTQGSGATLKIGGTSGITTLTATANPNTVDYNGAAQTVRAIVYHHLTLSGSGTKTMPGSTLTLNGNFSISGTAAATALAAINTAGSFTVGSTASFTTGSFTHDLKGDFSNSGTFTATGSTVTLTGTSSQAIGGSATTTFNHLTVNKASGGVTVNTTCNVGGTLTLSGGNVTTGSNTVVITSTGTVSRTSGHVVGNLQKNVATGSNVSRTFEIGDASNYTPVTVVFASVSVAGDLATSTSGGDHANIATSDVNPSKSVNRYWTMTASGGLAYTNYDATFNFVAGDVDAGATTANFVARRYSGGSWSSLTMGTRTSTSTQITGTTAFGDFQVGNVLSVAVSNSVFAFGTQSLNSWLAAQSSVITNDGTETETIVGKISTFTAGANTWTLSAVSNGADQVRAQWSTTSDTGPWTDISAYDTNFTISSSLAASGTVTLYLRIQTPTSTSSNNQYSSSLTVTAQ